MSIWRSRSCWSCRFFCMRRACLSFRRPFHVQKEVASVPQRSMPSCQALRKRQRSRRCWQRQTRHCFLPRRFLDATFGSFRKPPTFRASTKKLLCSRPFLAPPPSQFLPPASGTAPVAAAAFVPKPAPPREPPVPTAVRFGGALERRAWTPPQNFDFATVAVLPRQGLAPAEFLVAVSPDGLPMHLFPQRSSGNENLDRAALQYLAGCRFAAAPSELEPAWGTATFVWGADIRQDSQQ